MVFKSAPDNPSVPGRSLTEVLGQSQHIHDLLKQSAEELSSINTRMKLELSHGNPMPRVITALEKNEAVTMKLLEASKRLTAVNRALQIEIRDRTMIEHQFAAAVEQKEGARHAALHDNLTGLPNRVLFTDRLEHGIAQAKRHRWSLAVMFVDLDSFKDINDLHGHETGDAVLRSVATRLGHNSRNEDTVSRYGGDEFLYLLSPIHEHKDVAMIAVKILNAIRAPCEMRVGDRIVNLRLDASVGISVFPKDGDTAAALINRADEAMYAAKDNKTGFAFA